MGKNCFDCGKGVMYGHNMSHAKNRTGRIFEPNLHTARIRIDNAGKPSFAKASAFANASADKSAGKRVKLCVKCLRKLKKEMKKATAVRQVSPTPTAI